jgi:hypothetical protein
VDTESKVHIPRRAEWKLTPEVARELARIAEEAEWPPPEPLPPEYDLPLVACDLAFLGDELKELCELYGLSKSGHKKILCAKLISIGATEVLEAIEEKVPEAEALMAKEEEETWEE